MDPLSLIRTIMSIRNRQQGMDQGGVLGAAPLIPTSPILSAPESGRSGTFASGGPLKSVGDVRTMNDRLWSRDFNPPTLPGSAPQSPGINLMGGGATPMGDPSSTGGFPGVQSPPPGVPLAPAPDLGGTPLPDTSMLSQVAPPEALSAMSSAGGSIMPDRGIRGDTGPEGELVISPDMPSERDLLNISRGRQDMILDALMKQKGIGMNGPYPPIQGI